MRGRRWLLWSLLGRLLDRKLRHWLRRLLGSLDLSLRLDRWLNNLLLPILVGRSSQALA